MCFKSLISNIQSVEHGKINKKCFLDKCRQRFTFQDNRVLELCEKINLLDL